MKRTMQKRQARRPFRIRMLTVAFWTLCGMLPIFGTCIVSGSIIRDSASTATAVQSGSFESGSVCTVSATLWKCFSSGPVGISFILR